MARSTDSNTSFSINASALADLYPDSLSGTERLNDLGELVLGGHSLTSLSLDAALASHLTATLHHDDASRPLDALLAEVRQLPADATADHYQVVLRPWLWWLNLASNNRIFQNQSTADIVTGIFKDHGFEDIQLQLSGSYDPREYCVQYGETDLAFVSRLLEEEGIFWFFTHEDGKHSLVLADSNDACPAIPNGPALSYLGQDLGKRELHGIRSAQLCLQVVAGSYSAADYEFTAPSTSLYAQAQADSSALSFYEHPGGYNTKDKGDSLAKQRIDGLRSQQQRLVGESDCRWLVPGHYFSLTGHDDDSLNIDWLVTSVSHDLSHNHYRNSFEAIPRATSYRPPRLTPKPRIHTQTALVVGKSGEEIWTDEYGRIKVQFPWDREGQNDESSSCWVRVALPWTGKGFGMQFVPRIGQEVVVTFIDGDPDRPLVTGCVYNGDNALPYSLPGNQTQSGIKTQSSKGGGGFNELRFEDKKDSEEVFLQAQKDLNVNVLNDATATIGHDQTETVQNARTRTVKEGDETVTLEKGNRSVAIQTGSDSLDVKDKRTLSVGGDQSQSTGGNYSHTVSGNFDLTVDGNLTIKVSGTLALESSGSFSIKSGADLAVKASTSLSQEAGTSLSNQAGTELSNKAGTNLTNEASVSLVNKGSADQTVEGSGMLTLKGGLVQIN
ncbi:type VI secretion system tip protein TssI/VgrG [Gallaecimonas kandeliae]|uniref:type VI secretion system tip protein TssI/VgrG n=1 Tax=Gallaecimonas kandeliae TaxID=3029055 RepID=UPI0026488BFE|nr:type VI secretion system tip protein TssI/VgrG [Gallaecimonas kandeliae]WKE64486.1 type VI secretion system tip protein TssI/VgrG [Gallaecimonas kandeliae]